MKFALDEPHTDFASNIDALLDDAEVPRVSRALTAGDTAPFRALWKSLSDMDIPGLAIDEAHGGSSAEPLDVVVAMERLGRWAVPGPVVESMVAVPILLTHTEPLDRQGRDAWLAELASGDLIASLALHPAMPRAVDPHLTDLLLLVDADTLFTATVAAEHESVDPSRTLADLATADRSAIGVDHDAVAATEMYAALASAAQAIGAGHGLLDATAEYAKSRRQFGRAIGAFQAVKHELADVAIGLEMARPLLYGAALSLASNSVHARRDVSAAKIACTDAAHRASRTALQVHGAIGYTAECDLSLWINKVRVLRTAWGTAADHRRIVLEALCTF